MEDNIIQALLYGSVATLVVSLLSLGGLAVIPLLSTDTKHRWMHFFFAIAVSTLSSDAILHILPQIMGLHSHGDAHEHEHEHHNQTNETSTEHSHEVHHHHHHKDEHWYSITSERKVLLRLSIVMLTIYVLYFVEFVTYYRKKQQDGMTRSKISGCEETISNHAWDDSNCESNNNAKEDSCATSAEDASTAASELDDEGVVCWGLKSRALVILLGDGLHNFVDGVAIGASFVSSFQLGIVTTIAVICHELPHEIGDFAILIESGLSKTKALMLNFLSALTAFLGLYLSIAIGRMPEAEMLLLAVTAGMFLYVAWIDMMAHLKHDGAHRDHWLLACSTQYAGFIVGFSLIFALGWFEGQIFE